MSGETNDKEYIVDRNFLAETMVRRKFKKLNNLELPDKFWNLPKYRPEYQQQIRAAQKLLNIYEAMEIYDIILKNDWIYSLNLKSIPQMIEENKSEKDLVDFTPTETKEVTFRKR